VDGNCSTYGGEERCKYGLVWKPERKRSLGRPWRIWEDQIIRESNKWNGRTDWIELAQDSDRRRALVNEVKNYPVP